MDIVRTITFAHLKATLSSLKPKQKFFLSIFLLALILNLIPHRTSAFTIKAPTATKPILVFDRDDKSYLAIMDAIKDTYLNQRAHEQKRLEAVRRGKLTIKVQTYLENKNSPLAEYAPVLLSVKNWKRIVALANAESTLCRTYPKQLANCWGVGGADLWDMGDDLGDGVLEMNRFLTDYPKRSPVKYAQMTFKQMNGLYKQPAAAHWLYNVQTIYDDLVAIENSMN